MIPWWWAVVALFSGTVVGWFLCALCVASDGEREKGGGRE